MVVRARAVLPALEDVLRHLGRALRVLARELARTPRGGRFAECLACHRLPSPAVCSCKTACLP